MKLIDNLSLTISLKIEIGSASNSLLNIECKNWKAVRNGSMILQNMAGPEYRAADVLQEIPFVFYHDLTREPFYSGVMLMTAFYLQLISVSFS